MKALNDHPRKGRKQEVMDCYGNRFAQRRFVRLLGPEKDEKVEKCQVCAEPDDDPRLGVVA